MRLITKNNAWGVWTSRAGRNRIFTIGPLGEDDKPKLGRCAFHFGYDLDQKGGRRETADFFRELVDWLDNEGFYVDTEFVDPT